MSLAFRTPVNVNEPYHKHLVKIVGSLNFLKTRKKAIL
jgi:hypothetical protein